MDNVIFQIWNTLKINAPLSSETKWRIKKLFLLLVLLQANEEEICVIDKLEEINLLSEQEQLLNWFYDNFVRQRQLATEGEAKREITISPQTSAEILALVERYQTAAHPLQWTNFGDQIYIDGCLSRKIKLLYQIGTVANILNADEAFDDSTRVTQKTQDVCNIICDWIESNLGLKMERLNVYEPFIYKYKNFIYSRSEALKEIGVRSGLLSEEILAREDKISEIDAKVVIDWLDDNYQIKLISPEKYHPEIVNNLTIDYRQLFAKTALLVVPLVSLLPIGILVYDRFQKQPSPNLSEILLERELEVKKSLPKPAR